MGVFVTNLMDRMTKMQQLKAENAYKVQNIGLEAQAKAQAELGAQKELFKTISGGGGGGTGAFGGGVVTGTNIGGLNVEFPQAKGMVTSAEESAKQQAQVTPIAQSLQANLGRLRGLASTVTAPQAGLKKPFQEIGLRMGGALGTVPQVSEYQNVIRSMAGELARVIGREPSGRLSDQDIQRQLDRIEAGIYGTQEQRDLAFLGFVDSMNRNPQVANALGRISPGSLLSPEAVLKSRSFEGRNGTLLQDATGNFAIEYEDGTIEEF